MAKKQMPKPPMKPKSDYMTANNNSGKMDHKQAPMAAGEQMKKCGIC